MFIYGGGATIALCLDIEIRSGTDNQKSLDDVMSQMCLELGNTGKNFQYDDILRVANQVSGTDMGDFFSKYVAGKKELLPLGATLSKAGLRLNHFVDEHYLSRLDNPTTLQSAILAGLLGQGK